MFAAASAPRASLPASFEESMYGLLTVLHLLVCFGLIGVVLVQSGKGGGLAGGAFGGSAQTVFGGRGATDFMTRATMVLGGLFFLTSLSLALLSAGNMGRSSARSLVQEEARKAAASAPSQLPATGPNPAGGTTPATGTAPSGAGSTPSGGTAPPAAGNR
jgi:preprotein translocase subunit SecG